MSIQLQDVFWTGFADEVEKLATLKGTLGKGALLVGGAALAASALGKGKKGVDVTLDLAQKRMNDYQKKLDAASSSD